SDGRAIKVFNGGDMQRDFTYIDDIIDGVVRTIDNVPTDSEPEPCFRLFNSGNSQPIQLMDFSREMQQATDKSAQLDMLPMQAGDVPITYADTAQLQLVIGYKPSTSMSVGVGKFVDWYKKVYLPQ